MASYYYNQTHSSHSQLIDPHQRTRAKLIHHRSVDRFYSCSSSPSKAAFQARERPEPEPSSSLSRLGFVRSDSPFQEQNALWLASRPRAPSYPTVTPARPPPVRPPYPTLRSPLALAHRSRSRLGLARANSLPNGRPHTPDGARRSIGRTQTTPPPRARLPTSPTPASAVIGASGVTAEGRMVEYEHCRREALSRALIRAVSQSGTRRSRESTESSRRRSDASSNDGRELEPPEPGSACSSLEPPSPCGLSCGGAPPPPPELAPAFPSCGGLVRLPGSGGSAYISFASLNVLAPPSPAESVVGLPGEDDDDDVDDHDEQDRHYQQGVQGPIAPAGYPEGHQPGWWGH